MIFRSVEEALRWAYAIEARPVIAQPSAYGRCEVRTPVPQAGAAVWDRVGQAAAVRAQVERQDAPLCWLAIAIYSRTAARRDAARRLLEHLDPPAYMLSAFQLMLGQYCGATHDRGGIGRVRALLGCRRTTALELRRALFSRLDAIRLKLFGAVEPHLVEAGLVRAPAGNLPNLHRSESIMKRSSTELVIDTLRKLDPADFTAAGEKLALLYMSTADGKGLCEAANALFTSCLELAETERPVEITELQRDHTGKATRAMKRTSKPQLEDVGAAMVGFLSAVISLAVEAEPRKRVAR